MKELRKLHSVCIKWKESKGDTDKELELKRSAESYVEKLLNVFGTKELIKLELKKLDGVKHQSLLTKCRRCNGTGLHSHGKCFGCNGFGQVESKYARKLNIWDDKIEYSLSGQYKNTIEEIKKSIVEKQILIDSTENDSMKSYYQRRIDANHATICKIEHDHSEFLELFEKYGYSLPKEIKDDGLPF